MYCGVVNAVRGRRWCKYASEAAQKYSKIFAEAVNVCPRGRFVAIYAAVSLTPDSENHRPIYELFTSSHFMFRSR
jgi:hypothetical protein